MWTAPAWATWGPWSCGTASALPRTAWWWWCLPIAAQDGALLAPPEIITRGFIYVKESGDLMKELQNVAMDAADGVSGRKRSRDDGELRSAVKSAVSSYLFKNTKRSPMVIPVVTRL